MADISIITKEEIAKYLDYSFVLDPADTEEVYRNYIKEVKKYKFGAICLLPYRIPLVVAEIGDFCKENNIKIGGPVGFPYGQHTTETKVFEALDLVKKGATQLDMATNVAALKEGNYDYYKHELEELAKIGRDYNVMTKAIIQVGHLTDKEIKIATRFVADAGVDQVKTATGLLTPGRPSYNDMLLIKSVLDELGPDCKTKMKSTTSSLPEVYSFIHMGCESIGTGAGPEIIEKLPIYQKLYFDK
jgi:deoxyribose-phosphate aldolase